METQPASETSCIFKKSGDGQSLPHPPPKKKRLCHLTSVILWSLFWISWTLEAGTDRLSQNFSVELPPYTASKECRSHMVWQSRTWFGSAWSGSEWSGLAQSGSVLRMQISDDLTHLSAKYRGRKLYCICVNMVISASMSIAGINKVYNGNMLLCYSRTTDRIRLFSVHIRISNRSGHFKFSLPVEGTCDLADIWQA